jgi:glycosyltransferase involved in cell wall biosynthesis
MNAGGAETFLMKLYRKLDKSKYQMDFAVAVQEEGFYDAEIKKLGGKIYQITPKSNGIVRNFADIYKLVQRNKYTYVLRTSQHSLSALELFAAKLGGARTRVFRSSNSNTTTGSKKQLLLHKVCRFMPLLFANVRIAPSTEAAEFMFGKNCVALKKAFLLHNAVDINTYKYSENSRSRLRKELGVEGKFVVGHVGRFNQQKNHQFIIDVFLKLLEVNSEAVLILVGTGELQDEIKRYSEQHGISKSVVFLGVRKDVPELLSAFDVFLFPSFYEGMPNTVIEAQATGLPCIVSNTITKECNIADLVTFLSLNVEKDEWVKHMVNCNNDSRSSATMKICQNEYDIQSAVKQFERLVFENEIC